MLIELRVPSENERITVLIHGAANLDNIMFSYDEFSGRPNQVSEAVNKAIKFHYLTKSLVNQYNNYSYCSKLPMIFFHHQFPLAS